MKKIFVLIFALILTVSPVSKSEAALGIVTWNPTLVVNGWYTFELGFGVGLILGFANADVQDPVVGVIAGTFGVLGLLGLVVLDEEQETLTFTPLTEDQAFQMKITEEERDSFNNEVEEINLIAAEVQYEISQINDPSLEDSNKIWKEYTETISENSRKAFTKIIHSTLNR